MGKLKTLKEISTTSVQIEKSVYKVAQLRCIKEGKKLWHYITEAVREKNEKGK